MMQQKDFNLTTKYSMMKIQELKSAIVGCQINQNQDLTRGISQP